MYFYQNIFENMIMFYKFKLSILSIFLGMFYQVESQIISLLVKWFIHEKHWTNFFENLSYMSFIYLFF